MEEPEATDAAVNEETVTKEEAESEEEITDDDDDDEEDDDDEDDEEEGEDEDDDNGEAVEGEVQEGEEGETDDETEEEEEDEEELLEVSDTEGDASESCPICLNGLRDQDVGTPESCDHLFCLECILEWSKNVNTCPIDRQVFRLILCRHSGQDKIYKKLPVEDKSLKDDEEEEDEPVYCEVCQLSDREDRLLLCDGCDLGYHLECLTPPLDTVPVNEWFCPDCSQHQEQAEEESEARALACPFRRIIPRTLVMERVRSAIEEQRLQRTRSIRRILSSSEDEEDEPTPPSTSTKAKKTPTLKKASPKKKTTPRKYTRKTTKRRTKRKTTRKTTTTTRKTPRKTTRKRKTKGTRKGRKRKRKVKGRRKKTLARTARPQPMLTPKMRIAGALGLKSPPAGRSIPLQVARQEKSLDMKKADIGASTLSIFGSKEQLIHFDDDYGPPSDMPSSSTQRTSKYSRLALSSYRPIGRVPKIVPVKEKKKIVIKTTPAAAAAGTAAAASPLDLLGSIMSDQSKLHMDSNQITITRDGSLLEKPVVDSDKTNTSPSSLFKSSFTAVGSAVEQSASVLSALSNSISGAPEEDAEPELEPEQELADNKDEEYDPEHPTDDIDDDDIIEVPYPMGIPPAPETEPEPEAEEYDPAHPTDDFDNSDSDSSIGDSDIKPLNWMDEQLGRSQENTFCTERLSEIDKDESEQESSLENCIVEIQNDRIDEPAAAEDSGMTLNKSNEPATEENLDAEIFPISKSEINSPDTEVNVPSQENVIEHSPEKKPSVVYINKTVSAKSDQVKTPMKITEIAKKVSLTESAKTVFPIEPAKKLFPIETTKKISPIEASKKMSPAAKAEASKKALLLKKRMYGGVDFSQDVGFSAGGFPENFEVNIKKIEEVFKDTKSKSVEEKSKPENDDKIIESKEKEIDNQSENKTIIEIKPDNTPDDSTLNSEEKTKLSGLFKPLPKKDENKSSTKVTVSERFGRIKRKTKELDLEEEDPIHEMRKLDKELDLELENPSVGKRKEKEHRKSKRKVSIEGDEIDRSRKLKGRKGDSWDEIEEGEVEDEHKYRERKKKEKKRKKNGKEKYYDDIDSQYSQIDKGDGDTDTRIVIQVSQNTEDRTVWEEDERIRKKKDREERRKERDRSKDRESKREKKRRRHRSRSRSHDRKRSRSRDRRRSRSRSRDRSRRKHRDRSRSWSRDKSHERTRKRKKKDRDRSKERTRSRERDRSWDWEKESKRSREKSEDVDIFGRSRSPFLRKGIGKDSQASPKRAQEDPPVYIIDDDSDTSLSPKRPKLNNVTPVSKSKVKGKSISPQGPASKAEPTRSVGVVRRLGMESEKEEEFDDEEPEEVEQFQYTDRDEFLGQSTRTQQHGNLITLGSNSGDSYDPANPTEASSPVPPPLPELVAAPTPPLPPVGEFGRFPPPPPGPPPPGPPPPGVLIQERPPVHVQTSGPPPGPGILGEGPVLIRGPPPPLEAGPPPGMIQQQPNISMSPVMPQAFHQGLPQTIRAQRHVIMSPFRPGMPRMQRIPSPGAPRMGWQVTSATDMPGQFNSPSRMPPPLMNGPGPYDGLPPPQTEGPPHSLPPNATQFPPPPLMVTEPRVLPLQTDGPPPNLVQIPVTMEEPPPMGIPTSHMPLPVTEPHLVHIGPHPTDPPPRLPIPLLPTSTPPPMSVVVSIPPPGPGALSMSQPPPLMASSNHSVFPQGPPLSSVSSILRLPRGHTPPMADSAIPGLDMVGEPVRNQLGGRGEDEDGKQEAALTQLEEISKLLNTQAKLMMASTDKHDPRKHNHSGPVDTNDHDVFKRPLPPGVKSGGKTENVEITEVCDMDMASPILEEGNIELPISPEFDNLIDTDDWLEEALIKKTQKPPKEKEKEEKIEIVKDSIVFNDKEKPLNVVAKTKVKDQETRKDSPKKPKEEKVKKSSKENKPVHQHRHRKHRHKPDPDKDDFKLKALKDAHFEIDSQEVPSSAVEMTNKEKYLKKLHLQERVVEEVKMAIKPHYSAKKINKDQYKEILRKAVPKICHSKSGDINPMKIKALVEAYVDKYSKHGGHHHDDSDIQLDISPGVKANGERTKVAQAAR